MLKRIVTITALAVGGAMLAKQMKKTGGGKLSSVRETIEVDVPVRTAYNQFTQFEDFPQFMESVHEVRQLDDKRLHWRADVMGKQIEWDAEITEQIPDQRIAWRSTSGARNDGVASFQRLSDQRTRVTLEMRYEPGDMVEAAGDALGAVRSELRSNLQKYKEMIERRGTESGAWRGTISGQGEAGKPH